MFSKDFFDNFFIDFDEVIKEFREKVDEETNDKDKSYYHYVSDEYKDGNHISHKEKIIKDGEVVKDENRCIDYKVKEKNIGDNKCKAEEREKEENAINISKQERNELKHEIRELTVQNKALKEEIEELRAKNSTLEKKVAQIKNIFK